MPKTYQTKRSIKAAAKAARPRPLALLYIRVSTSKQVEDGVSLDAQEAMLRAAAVTKGWDVEVVREEGKSAKSLDRPALADARARLAAGDADILAAVRLDRISRSVKDFCDLIAEAKAQGWSVVCLDPDVDMTSVTGEVVATVLVAMGRFEREMTSQRTREGMAQLKAEGRTFGTPQALRLPPETERLVCDLIDQTGSLAETARILDARGVPTARGGRWQVSTVQSINLRHARRVSA